MAKAKKPITKLQCADCKRITHFTRKPKKVGDKERKLELKKYCKFCKKNTPHKEGKK